MASNEELKIAIITEARLDALKRATKEYNKFKVAIDAQKELKRLNRGLKSVQPAIKKSAGLFSRLNLSIAKGILIAKAAEVGLRALRDGIEQIGQAVLISAQVEELGNVYEFVGEKAGFTTTELKKFSLALKASGIDQKATNQVLLRGLQANIKLTDVVKLGSVAQDAATIGLTDSSDAHLRLVESVAKLQPRLLKELGIIVNLNEVYKKASKELGKNATELTEVEKKTAFLNEIFAKGVNITGAYEKAMESTSKRMRSLNRLFIDAQVAVGDLFQDEFSFAITTAEVLLKAITKLAISTTDATEKFFSLRDKMRTNSTQTLELADRYDILKGKLFLTNEQQVEFNQILDTLTTQFPTAITAWTEYGDAVGVSTGKIRESIDAQRALFRIQQADQINVWKDSYASLKDKIDGATSAIKFQNTPVVTMAQGIRKINRGIDEEGLLTNIAGWKDETKDLVGALSIGFDAVNNFDFVVRALGDEGLANLILKYQLAEQGQKKLNDTVASGTEIISNSVLNKPLFEEAIPLDDDFFSKQLFGIDDAFGTLDLSMQQFEARTVQGFINMANQAQSFFDQLSQGQFTFGGLLSLFSTGLSIATGLGIIGPAATAGGFTQGLGPLASSGISGGVNIQGNLTVVTQATSAQAVAREIENLSSRNLTTIQAQPQRITR